MVARVPQQVLLLLVLVAGASVESTQDKKDSIFYVYARRTTKQSSRVTWSSPSTSSPSSTSSSSPSASTSSSSGRTLERILERVLETTPSSSDVLSTDKLSGLVHGSSRMMSHESSKMQTAIRNYPSNESSSFPSTRNRRDELEYPVTEPFENFEVPANGMEGRNVSEHVSVFSTPNHDIVPTTKIPPTSELVSIADHGNVEATTVPSILSSRDDLLRRRQMRHAADKCEKFMIGDEAKKEFYSPNYPNPYPNHTECIRVLEADKGMLLKLDFRDEFKLEDSPGCRFDSLEVRDGKHGYSNLLGNFCGSNFPPEITSQTRYLWLRFHSDENIEGKGFKAVWSMIPRPTYPGVPPETEPCLVNVTGNEAIISHDDVKDKKKLAEREGIPLDCMWVIRVKEGWKIQLGFPDHFKLQRPNECDANFVDVFEEKTDLRSRLKNFCGSIADNVVVKSNLAYVRYYAEPKALNSTFEGVMTAIRDKDASEGACKEGEYDCEDMTCIASNLQCNGRVNCRFRWDEDESICDDKKSSIMDSQHIVIILVVFSLIVFGMSFAFVFNCVRKLVRDHRIIQEHIRQSRENRLDELGRKSTPRPLSASRTDIRDRSSESPSLEVVPSKELLPPTTVIPEEYTVAYNNKITYNSRDMNDIHQSNNVSNATQERLQESSEEPEMRDNSCQTRESLFEPRLSDTVVPPAFTTFGFRGSQNGTNYQHHRHHHYHHHHHPQSPQKTHQSPALSHQSSQQSSHQSSQQSSQQQQSGSQCSGCSPASRGRDGSMGVCPKHNPIPAPPGWSTHESSYTHHQSGQYQEVTDYPSYQRYQNSKSPAAGEGGGYHQSPKFVRQNTIGSGERYGSSIYGSGKSSGQISGQISGQVSGQVSGHGSSNATTPTQHSTSSKSQQQQQASNDPRYKAEAIIEIDQRRPFSIDSTKSAPDVIATH